MGWTDAHTALTSMATLGDGDLLIAISHSGTTRDIVDVMQAFQAKGTQTVIITNNPRSSAAGKADMKLLTTAGESPFRSGATASRIAQLTLVDCLCIALAQRDMARTKTALDQSLAAVGGRYLDTDPLPTG
ncbi:putative HTH-type transcriptional regulator YbbH [mine drainage metagenome]|uniref:Putative HTH-type transcriptional regulator YbbH n=1 Tax=mine drainage metagenome TaxID=410659 RepID=A0A1J5PAU5_9ZZZZ